MSAGSEVTDGRGYHSTYRIFSEHRSVGPGRLFVRRGRSLLVRGSLDISKSVGGQDTYCVGAPSGAVTVFRHGDVVMLWKIG